MNIDDTSHNTEVQQIHLRLRDLHEQKMALHDTLARFGFEEASLHKRLLEIEKPPPAKRHPRHCRICRVLTLDLVDGMPQCTTHPLVKVGRNFIMRDEIRNIDGDTVADILKKLRS